MYSINRIHKPQLYAHSNKCLILICLTRLTSSTNGNLRSQLNLRRFCFTLLKVTTSNRHQFTCCTEALVVNVKWHTAIHLHSLHHSRSRSQLFNNFFKIPNHHPESGSWSRWQIPNTRMQKTKPDFYHKERHKFITAVFFPLGLPPQPHGIPSLCHREAMISFWSAAFAFTQTLIIIITACLLRWQLLYI